MLKLWYESLLSIYSNSDLDSPIQIWTQIASASGCHPFPSKLFWQQTYNWQRVVLMESGNSGLFAKYVYKCNNALFFSFSFWLLTVFSGYQVWHSGLNLTPCFIVTILTFFSFFSFWLLTILTLYLQDIGYGIGDLTWLTVLLLIFAECSVWNRWYNLTHCFIVDLFRM